MDSSRLNGEDSDTNEEDDFDDDIDFKKSKMPRLDTDDTSNATATTSDSSKSTASCQDEGELCPICFECWTNAGAHRLVCLKCGHLFGESCIDRWIKSNPKCPQCNRPSKRTDIRRIYAKTIKVIDTAELDKALKDLEAERMLRKKAEINTSEMKIQYQVLLEDYNRMKDDFQRYKLQNSNQNSLRLMSSSQMNNDRLNSTVYGLDKTINITDLGGCRVTAYSNRCVALLVSQPSNSALFPGFGIKKINFLDYKLNQYIPIHSKTIRDLAINTSNDDGIILTCGLDKTIKLTNIINNVIIHSYSCEAPVWSCTFNNDNPLYFYAGLQNGKVLSFDKRKTDRYLDILNNDIGCCQPISSLQYISNESALKQSGLLVTHLDRTVFYGTQNFEQYNYYPLLIENNMTCSSFESQSGLLLVSIRPTEKHPSVRHLSYEFSINKNQEESNDDTSSQVSLNLLNSFIGAPKSTQFLSKSKIFQYNNEIYACAPDPSNSVLIWNVRKNETIAKLQNTNEVLDTCPIHFNNTHYISTLTEKQLRVFKRNID